MDIAAVNDCQPNKVVPNTGIYSEVLCGSKSEADFSDQVVIVYEFKGNTYITDRVLHFLCRAA